MSLDAPSHRAQQIVRRTAELLATDLPTDTLFEQLCVLLAKFVDASLVFIALRHGETVRIEFMYDHGISRRRAAVPVNPQSQTRRVFETGESVLFRTLDELPGPVVPLAMNAAPSDDGQSMMYVPLRFGSRNIGVLSVQSPIPNAYTGADLELLETCALYIAVALNSAILESENIQLEKFASVDALTGVANRRTFDERLMFEWNLAQRRKINLSMVLLDIDFFKAFNDAYGHIAGDACLKQVAQAAGRCVTRPSDVFARYGGEEFAIILPETNVTGAITTAERIRTAIDSLGIPHQGSEIGRVTASLGIAACIPAEGVSKESLVNAADKALYFAKSGGRNRVVADSYQSDSPKTQRRYTVKHNLPSDLTTFVGRSREIGEVSKLVNESRLTTLLGPGGVGKTRLSIVVARHVAGSNIDGVAFIDLARVSEPSMILQTIATTLSVFEQPGRSLRSTLVEHLRDKAMLLILDNCEQLIAPCAELAETLLHSCPDLRMLATSREPLGVPGERTYRLAPFEERDAVELFTERANLGDAVGRDATTARSIAEVCGRLDGIPLAIELAAARAKEMTLDQLSSRLQDRFAVLSKGSRNAQPRQKTLRALIDWSFDLLSEPQRRLLRRLSVFVGGWTIEAAEEVCSDETLPEHSVLDLLGELTDKSLVVADQVDREYRYRLLESTREYAHERLEIAEELKSIRDKHARFFTKVAARAAHGYAETSTSSWLAPLLVEHENFRDALRWALTEKNDIVLGAQCAASLSRFWYESGRIGEGRRWLAQSLAHGESSYPLSIAADLWHGVDILAMAQGDYTALLDAAKREKALYEQLGNRSRIASALNGMGIALHTLGDFAAAEEHYIQALTIRRELGEKRGISVGLENLADLARDYHHDYDRAEQLYREALDIARELGQEALAAVALGDLAELTWMRGEYDRAVTICRESLAIFERFENQPRIAEQLERIARFELARGNILQSIGPMTDALEIFRQLLHYEGLAQCFDDAFHLSVALGKIEPAALISGFVEHLREVHHLPRSAAQQLATENQRSALLEYIETDHYGTLFEEGRTWSLQQALAAAAELRM
ncbi:MAG: diguanylate cyclase [Candidatus Eremiobacteraeota bacterium]|nr:diguanylate cyclase [Candidatus Eremiobacteraeota bacterium]